LLGILTSISEPERRTDNGREKFQRATAGRPYAPYTGAVVGSYGVTESAGRSSGVRGLAQDCIAAAHLDSVLDSNFSVEQAMDNAEYLFKEFGKLIPEKSLDGYRSHCWLRSFFVQWTKYHWHGYIGNISFSKETEDKQSRLKPLLRKSIPVRKYSSKLVCLPNVFLAGFPKCGSTFLYCFITKLVALDTKLSQMNTLKEPHFWAVASARGTKHMPSAEDLGGYLLNFVPGLKQIQDFKRPKGMVMDGTPNTMFNWPRFRNAEHDLTNYCILPAVLPRLLPNSKFVVIMRNPVKMLYSAFWFSCTTIGKKLPEETVLMGPGLFHERVVSKIAMFNKCMRDKSVPSISHTCEVNSNYNLCIGERLHLLERCSHKITFNLYSPELKGCGRSRIAMGLYYVHVKKWLSIVPKDRFLFLTLEGLVDNPLGTAHKIQDFLGLKTEIDHDSMKHILNSCYENSQTSVDYKHDPKLQMRNDTKLTLEHFYYPFNSLLADITGNSELLWR
jgi:hypothetical protein